MADGYFGLNIAFLVNVLIAVGINFSVGVSPFSRSADASLSLLGGLYGFLFIAVIALTLKPNQKIALGKDWPPSNALLASLLMGLNSVLCCGIIGYVVMQQIAFKEMKKYGIQSGFFGVKKQQVEAIIREMQAHSVQPSGFRP